MSQKGTGHRAGLFFVFALFRAGFGSGVQVFKEGGQYSPGKFTIHLRCAFAIQMDLIREEVRRDEFGGKAQSPGVGIMAEKGIKVPVELGQLDGVLEV